MYLQQMYRKRLSFKILCFAVLSSAFEPSAFLCSLILNRKTSKKNTFSVEISQFAGLFDLSFDHTLISILWITQVCYVGIRFARKISNTEKISGTRTCSLSTMKNDISKTIQPRKEKPAFMARVIVTKPLDLASWFFHIWLVWTWAKFGFVGKRHISKTI